MSFTPVSCTALAGGHVLPQTVVPLAGTEVIECMVSSSAVTGGVRFATTTIKTSSSWHSQPHSRSDSGDECPVSFFFVFLPQLSFAAKALGRQR